MKIQPSVEIINGKVADITELPWIETINWYMDICWICNDFNCGGTIIQFKFFCCGLSEMTGCGTHILQSINAISREDNSKYSCVKNKSVVVQNNSLVCF